MGLLDTIMANDGEHFANSDEFAESVTYIKRDGTERTINAVIQREVPETMPDTVQRVLAPVTRAWVRNDSTSGIAATELESGLRVDKLRIAKRYGGSDTEDLPITTVLNEDGGMLELRLR